MVKATNIKNYYSTSLWIVYVIIVFEILYMISPFALYYYSIYKVPLIMLQSNSYTAFLTQNILPHFTSTTSLVITLLNIISWPLIIIGLILFLIGFFQIYWAKFMRKGVVLGGVYNIIRHPQYVALAILGLGTTIYWSRFIVYISYSTMLFLYYFLAKHEEKICLEKFGASYQKYYEHTGMFLPRIIEKKLQFIPTILPRKPLKRIISIVIMYVIYISIIIESGFIIRNYALSKITASYSDDHAVISIASLADGNIQKAFNIVMSDEKVKENLIDKNKYLFYIVPYEWSIPELGIIRPNEKQDYLMNPTTHGNSNHFNEDSLIVLIAEPILPSMNLKGQDILKKSLSYIPYFEVFIDLKNGKLISLKDRKDRGKWDGIPVPIY